MYGRTSRFALGWTPGRGLGTPPAAPGRICRAADPRVPFRSGIGPLFAGRGATARRYHRGGARRYGDAHCRRPDKGTGHFNLGQGVVGTATGLGASLSTTLAGYLSDHFGNDVAFSVLAAIATAGLAAVWTSMKETRAAAST
jgi:hypothetical protein